MISAQGRQGGAGLRSRMPKSIFFAKTIGIIGVVMSCRCDQTNQLDSSMRVSHIPNKHPTSANTPRSSSVCPSSTCRRRSRKAARRRTPQSRTPQPSPSHSRNACIYVDSRGRIEAVLDFSLNNKHQKRTIEGASFLTPRCLLDFSSSLRRPYH